MSEDNFIIIEVLSGKKEQYSILMDRYHNELFKYIYNITNDYNATEDLLQEVFIKIYKNLSKFDSDKASFRTWIYRISSNHVMNYFNSKEYKNRQHNITLETVSSSDDVEGDYIKDQKINLILKTIKSVLKPKHQKIMLLHFFSGLTVNEISETTDIPIKTIYKALKSSIEKIKQEVNINE